MSQTAQEDFWIGQFGDDYIARNESPDLLAANLHLFSKVAEAMEPVSSVFEVGANVGMNLRALRQLMPQASLTGLEINAQACETLSKLDGVEAIHGSILDFDTTRRFDLVFTKTVLIHINPGHLNDLYAKIVELSNRYVMVCEYYNPAPVTIPYRGHTERLFKRDFAGEIMDQHGLRLIDYGFHYHRHPTFRQDDVTWFLMEKTSS